MAKHKPPTKTELSQWEKYGSYAGSDAVQRMIVEIHNLHKRLDALKIDNTDLRKALEDMSKDFHSCDCPEAFGPYPSPGCQCHVGLAKEALRKVIKT